MSKLHRIPYSWQRIPPSNPSLQKWKFSWIVLSFPRINPPPPTQIGTSHGGLKDFSSELPKNTPPQSKFELLIEDLGISILSFPRMPPPTPTQIGTSHRGLRDLSSKLPNKLNTPFFPPTQNWNFSWRTLTGTGVWRLITVSPADTVSLSIFWSFSSNTYM